MRLLLFIALISACGDEGGDGPTNELITTVTLDFMPMGGGPTINASFNDADGDGGDPPVIDPITLTPGTYTTGVQFLNSLETPPEDITIEVRDESDEHQVFFTGTSIDAALTHSYLDTDVNGSPIGLSNRFVAARGTGTLIVTLRHLPPINGNPVKTADVAAQVKAGGFAAIGGSSDASVTFMVTVP